jgi:AraC-like DNA-binding protein
VASFLRIRHSFPNSQKGFTKKAKRRRLAGLARRWGFTDVSTFNRAFRQTFGISPGEARASALTGQSAADLPKVAESGLLTRWIAQISGAPRPAIAPPLTTPSR